jgi:UDP-N-acetylglucosamine--N-acetylmuramyl-(pentapeptide) pyrophosphoryl-undecaprenol N-acetylglucosamine transferase
MRHSHQATTSGGYVALPVGTAAWLLRRPLVVHEQITALGLTNRDLARLATTVAASHAATLDHLPPRVKARAEITGNPIRADLLIGDVQTARAAFGLSPDLPVLYVTGGAQGSEQINRLVEEVLPELLSRAQVVHQCGEASVDRLRTVRDALPADLAARYSVLPFVSSELPHLYAATDVVLSRAGAGTIAELTALAKPSILIPLVPTGGDEQRRNARHLADSGAAVCLTGSDATAANLLSALFPLLDDPATRKAMGESAGALGRPDAAASLAGLLVSQWSRQNEQ